MAESAAGADADAAGELSAEAANFAGVSGAFAD
jgi:hypothetical protein